MKDEGSVGVRLKKLCLTYLHGFQNKHSSADSRTIQTLKLNPPLSCDVDTDGAGQVKGRCLSTRTPRENHQHSISAWHGWWWWWEDHETLPLKMLNYVYFQLYQLQRILAVVAGLLLWMLLLLPMQSMC